jgi:hypothetical protein
MLLIVAVVAVADASARSHPAVRACPNDFLREPIRDANEMLDNMGWS